MAKQHQARSHLSRQLSLLVAQAPNIPLEVGLYPWRFDAPFSELNWKSYGAPKNMLQVLRSCVIPRTEKRMNLRSGYSVPNTALVAHEDQEAWFFVNGPGADKPLLQANGDALAEIFGRKINLLHNVSEGLVNDLLECVTGKTGLHSSRTATSLCKLLEVELRQRNKVVLIAHSQGASIAFHAIDKLAERLRKAGRDLSLLRRLEFYTFGAAYSDRALPEEVYAEHFANAHDVIANVGILACGNVVGEQVFVAREGRGHLLNAHYLPDFKLGRYHGRQGRGSRLSSYLRRT